MKLTEEQKAIFKTIILLLQKNSKYLSILSKKKYSLELIALFEGNNSAIEFLSELIKEEENKNE